MVNGGWLMAGFLLWYTLVLGESQFSIAMLNYQRVWFMGIVSLYLVGGFNHLEKYESQWEG